MRNEKTHSMHTDTLQLILIFILILTYTNQGGMTALMAASRGSNATIVTKLLAAGADINASNEVWRDLSYQM